MEIEIACIHYKKNLIYALGLKQPSDGKNFVWPVLIVQNWIRDEIHSFYVIKDGEKLLVYIGKYPESTPWEQRHPFVTTNSDGSDPKSLEFLLECIAATAIMTNVEDEKEPEPVPFPT